MMRILVWACLISISLINTAIGLCDSALLLVWRLTPLIIVAPFIINNLTIFQTALYVGSIVCLFSIFRDRRDRRKLHEIKNFMDNTQESYELISLSISPGESGDRHVFLSRYWWRQASSTLINLQKSVFILRQVTFNKEYLSGLNCIMNSRMSVIFCSRDRDKLVSSIKDRFYLFHEIAHCDGGSIALAKRTAYELAWTIPVLLIIFLVPTAYIMQDVWTFAGLMLALYGLILIFVPILTICQSEIRADTIGLHLVATATDNVANSIAALRKIKLPVDVKMLEQAQKVRQTAFDEHLDLMSVNNSLYFRQKYVIAPAAYRIIYLVIIYNLSVKFLWKADFASFHWYILWFLYFQASLESYRSDIAAIQAWQSVAKKVSVMVRMNIKQGSSPFYSEEKQWDKFTFDERKSYVGRFLAFPRWLDFENRL